MEDTEARLKRLTMRSNRRGIKEMDIILGRFAALALAELGETDLLLYDLLLSENDHDLYQWVSGQAEVPLKYVPLVANIAEVNRIALKDTVK